MEKLIFALLSVLICTCAVQTVIVDLVEMSTIKKYLIPKGSIVLSQDTILIDREKMIKIKYFGRPSPRE